MKSGNVTGRLSEALIFWSLHQEEIPRRVCSFCIKLQWPPSYPPVQSQMLLHAVVFLQRKLPESEIHRVRCPALRWRLDALIFLNWFSSSNSKMFVHQVRIIICRNDPRLQIFSSFKNNNPRWNMENIWLMPPIVKQRLQRLKDNKINDIYVFVSKSGPVNPLLSEGMDQSYWDLLWESLGRNPSHTV